MTFPAISTVSGSVRARTVGCSILASSLASGMQYCTSAARVARLSPDALGCGSGAHPAVHRQFKEESVEA